MTTVSLRSVAITALISFATFAASPLAHAFEAQSEDASKSKNWRKPEECIAGTPTSRRRAARSLGFGRGRWIVAYFSAYCLDCDNAAVELNKLVERERVLGLTIAPANIADKWKKELRLKYRVTSVSEQTFEDLGAVVLPTIVLFEDGEAKAAYTPSMGNGQ